MSHGGCATGSGGVLAFKVAVSTCAFLVVVLHCQLQGVVGTTPCFHLSECSGHGVCNSVSRTCTCYDGWGGPNDLATYKAPDCSLRACRVLVLSPPGLGWGFASGSRWGGPLA
jgi:hypothetical protein